MFETRSLALADDGDYDIIESAVMESARGRRFLMEYARRNRSADTEMLLGAIGRLESAVVRERVSDDVGRLRGDLMDMAQAISRTRAEIAAIQPADRDHSRLTAASEALDAIVRSTETATSDILSAAEEIQEATWTLREAGTSAALCDELDRRATQIYTACSFQDLTAQRTSRVVHTLRYLEERIASMITIWGGGLDEVPPAPNEAARDIEAVASELCQNDVDRVLQTATESSAPAAARAPIALPVVDDIAFFPVATPDAEPEQAFPVLEADGGVEDLLEPAGPAAEEAEEAWLAEDSADAIEDMLAPEQPAVPAAEPAPAAPTVAADTVDDDLALAFGDLDKLSLEEKLALFA